MNCNIIKDLMVLYASGECSDESKAAIMEHMATCPGCKAIWETMEAGELEAVCEEEKETEFQQVTKEIKKRNWRKIFKRTVAYTLIAGVALSAAGTMYIRAENAGPYYVNTGNVTYWPQDDAWKKEQIIFSYKGENYTYFIPGEDIGAQLFGGKAMPFFRFSSNWDICEDKSRAVFNVQEANYGFMADLMLENNVTTMYETGSRIEENMYLCARQMDFFLPLKSKEKVLNYYNDESNYGNWTLSEFIDAPMTDANPEENTVERDDIKLSLMAEDVDAIREMLVSGKPIPMDSELIDNKVYVELHMSSNDGVMQGHMSIEKIEGKWYAVGEETQTGANEYVYATLELPKSIGDKIERALEQ